MELLHLSLLKNKKNLLAFSAGIDSSALFFLLLNKNITFDIAIVDYNMREQSKDEVQYAKDLALKYNKNCFVKDVKCNSSNFEKNARDLRYDFFEEVIIKHQYDTLLTAHQLNDKLEWFLMQLSKGAGLSELIGLESYEKRDTYQLVRPLLKHSKEELEIFLENNKIKFFIDNSNLEDTYKRNYFRKKFANDFIDEFKNGVQKSFEYLQNDLNSLDIRYESILKIKKLEIFTRDRDDNKNIRVIDKNLKKRGFLLSSAQRDEILKQKEIVIKNKISISIDDQYLWIAPFSNFSMEKKFKEICRINKIPSKMRAYLGSKNIDINKIVKNLKNQ